MNNNQKNIIIVDDDEFNLITCKHILKPHYTVFPALSAVKLFDLLDHFIPDLILLDIEMPVMDGYETMEKLKSIDAYKNIPIIFLSGNVDPESETRGMNLGALDYFNKPFVSELILKRLENHFSMINYRKILKEQNISIKELRPPLNTIIDMLGTALETKENDKMQECIEKANDAAKHLLALIDDTK